jgi:hypothetical protein
VPGSVQTASDETVTAIRNVVDVLAAVLFRGGSFVIPRASASKVTLT